MPAWPKEEDFQYNVLGDAEFDRALAAAWEARCRVAVKALQAISNYEGPLDQMTADEALETIGELPK